MKNRWNTFIAICGWLALSPLQANALSLPDTTFGTGGLVTLEVAMESPVGDAGITDGLVDQSGRIVTVGTVSTGHYSNEVPHRHLGLVTRRLPDGSPDLAFDSDGDRALEWNGYGMELGAVREEPGGRLIVAGTATDGPAPHAAIVCRIEVDGAFDLGFGDLGCRELRRVRDAQGAWTIVDIELLPDGRILALGRGTSETGDKRGVALFRLTPQGKPDLGFGDDTVCDTPAPRCGVAVTPASLGPHIVPAALAIHEPSQRILVATAINVDSLHALPVLAFDADGTYQSGLYTFNFGALGLGGMHQATDIRVSPDDGSVYMTATVAGAVDQRLAIAKLGPDGAPDSAFGNKGRVIGESMTWSANGASILQAGGTLLVAFRQQSDVDEPVRCRLARFDTTSGHNDAMSGGDGAGVFAPLDVVTQDCIAESLFPDDTGVLIAGNLISSPLAPETPFIVRLDTVRLMRDGFEP